MALGRSAPHALARRRHTTLARTLGTLVADSRYSTFPPLPLDSSKEKWNASLVRVLRTARNACLERRTSWNRWHVRWRLGLRAAFGRPRCHHWATVSVLMSTEIVSFRHVQCGGGLS